MLSQAKQLQAWVWRCASFLSQNMDEKARIDLGVYNYIHDELVRHLGSMKNRTVLDIGCGPRYQMALLFQSFGSKGIGIDMDLVGPRLVPPWKYYQLWRHDGYRRAIQVLARDVSGRDRSYYKALERVAGVPLRFDEVEIHDMSVFDMKFPDETFDAAVSNLVLEHVSDIPRAAGEIARTLKKEGMIYFVIHNFTSLSGGHQPGWWEYEIKGVPASVPPWDHLRKNLYPSPVYLNKLRRQDYLDIFGKHFDILSVRDDNQGEEILTPELEAELSTYSRQELLSNFMHLVARKKR